MRLLMIGAVVCSTLMPCALGAQHPPRVTSSVPAWMANAVPSDSQWVRGVATGVSFAEALLSALGDIANEFDRATLRSVSAQTRMAMAQVAVGPCQIEVVSTERGGEATAASARDVSLACQDAGDTLQVTYSYKETQGGGEMRLSKVVEVREIGWPLQGPDERWRALGMEVRREVQLEASGVREYVSVAVPRRQLQRR